MRWFSGLRYGASPLGVINVKLQGIGSVVCKIFSTEFDAGVVFGDKRGKSNGQVATPEPSKHDELFFRLIRVDQIFQLRSKGCELKVFSTDFDVELPKRQEVQYQRPPFT